MLKQTALFLSQSYRDTWDDYKRSLIDRSFARWDYVVLTASNVQQAEAFRRQIRERQDQHLLPEGTKYLVVPDRDGQRIGSGGATLSVLRTVADIRGSADFSGLRILVIHSGGDSKRVPQYSALGKLFSPVPHELEDGRSSTLFDEFLISMASVPSRFREGMLLLSGDVLLLYNPLQIDYSGKDAAVISFKEDVSTGKNHGVFLRGEDGNVARFLHKQSVDTLMKSGAVNEKNCVDIDTGAVLFSADILHALYTLVADDNDYRTLVNDRVRLSLYGDFLYPMATDSALDAFYEEKAEGENTPELRAARTLVWQALRPYRMKLLRLAPAKFLHFGTTREILELMGAGMDEYRALGWSRDVGSSIGANTAGYNSVVAGKAKVGKNAYLEVAYVHGKARVGAHTVLSYLDVEDEIIPADVVLHGLKQKDGRFVVRIFGVEDNPKESKVFGKSIPEIAAKLGVSEDEVFSGEDRSLWSAALYPACDTVALALKAALNFYDLVNGKGDVDAWRTASRKSLASGFRDADTDAITKWSTRMCELVRMNRLQKAIEARVPASQTTDILKASVLTGIQRYWLAHVMKSADYSEAMRLHFYLGKALGGIRGDRHIAESFRTVRRALTEAETQNFVYREDAKIAMDRHTVTLPLRVNFGGGWSDTPPYCNECGGTVLNAAILLDGKRPVKVTLERIPEKKIVFDSRDMDSHGEFDTIRPLQSTGDPFDEFALQKAALLACGILPRTGGNLSDILDRLGGGFIMHSEVTDVPKGSGLGTSSILSAACAKALLEFTGIPYTTDDIVRRVLCMEQIMSTGGGWQDQVGGLFDGIKFITSAPGIYQSLNVRSVSVSPETMAELNERFVLIYTGQRRLARNLLRDVIGKYIGAEPDTVSALDEIQHVAALMRFELERGNVDAFAELLNRHWELSKKIDSGSTNALIDQIFASISDLIDGKMICGAGGGGFLQVILKKGVDKADVKARLYEVFQDSGVDTWDSTII